jgi:hypothetical protein
MLITCKKCGKTANGRRYTFHLGELLDSKSGTHESFLDRQVWVKTTYRMRGEAGADICNCCASPKLGVKWLVYGILFIVLSVANFVLMAVEGLLPKVGWQLLVFPIGGLVLGIVVTTLAVLERSGKGLALPNQERGEKAAIAARRQEFQTGQGPSMVIFWTSKEFQNLRQRQVL